MSIFRMGLVVLGILAASILSFGQQGAGAIVAIDEAVGIGPAGIKGGGGSAGQTRSTSGASTTARAGGRSTRTAKATTKAPPAKTRTVAAFKGPVIGDKYSFLNFEVISAAKPTHTIAAKKAGASGLVQVEVLVGENGDVLSAKARTGNKLLWDEAERAALASKFNKPTVNGQRARAMGFLVYRFGNAEEDDGGE